LQQVAANNHVNTQMQAIQKVLIQTIKNNEINIQYQNDNFDIMAKKHQAVMEEIIRISAENQMNNFLCIGTICLLIPILISMYSKTNILNNILLHDYFKINKNDVFSNNSNANKHSRFLRLAFFIAIATVFVVSNVEVACAIKYDHIPYKLLLFDPDFKITIPSSPRTLFSPTGYFGSPTFNPLQLTPMGYYDDDNLLPNYIIYPLVMVTMSYGVTWFLQNQFFCTRTTKNELLQQVVANNDVNMQMQEIHKLLKQTIINNEINIKYQKDNFNIMSENHQTVMEEMAKISTENQMTNFLCVGIVCLLIPI